MKKTITFALWLMSSCAAASHSDFSWHGYVAPVSYTHLTLPTNREV